MKEQNTLYARHCFRCSYTWWPRQRKSPRRCARCKSPYWNRPRRKGVQNAASMDKKLSSLACSNIGSLSSTPVQSLVPTPPPNPEPDRSFANALAVLRQMKTEKATWAEMAERLRQEFNVQLDKDQVKGLVRQ